MNPALFSGLDFPVSIAVSEGNLFVANFYGGTVGEYAEHVGATVNPALISGLSFPSSIAVSGGNLFIGTFDFGPETGTIGEYNATTGATVNASLISGLHQPVGIAVVSASVPEVSSTWTLLLLALAATFGISPLLRRQATDHFRSI